MLPFRTLLERTAFHIPYSHEWLVERDSLRNESRRLRESSERMSAELQGLEKVVRALWQPPGHFYSPIPDVKDLQSNRERVFGFPPSIPDVDFNEGRQLELLDRFREWYPEQPFTEQKSPGRRYFFDNANYSYTQFFITYLLVCYRDRIEAEFPLFKKCIGGSLWLRKGV